MDEKIIMQGKNYRISDIKEELKSIQDGKLDGFIKKYDEDTRSGVVKLVDTAKKRMEKEDRLQVLLLHVRLYFRWIVTFYI